MKSMVSGLSYNSDWCLIIILEMFKLDGPFLNDWVEVAQRKVSFNEFHSGIVRGKTVGNSWH